MFYRSAILFKVFCFHWNVGKFSKWMLCCAVLIHSVMFNSLWPPWTAARQASLSFTISQSFLKLMSMGLWCHPAISSSTVPFSSCPQYFPASGSFPMSQLFPLGAQSIGASASVLPMNIQGWLTIGLIGS